MWVECTGKLNTKCFIALNNGGKVVHIASQEEDLNTRIKNKRQWSIITVRLFAFESASDTELVHFYDGGTVLHFVMRQQ